MARLLPKAKFVYNNAKNAETGNTSFELHYGYYLCILYKQDFNPYSNLKIVEKLTSELENLIDIYQQNLYYIQKL